MRKPRWSHFAVAAVLAISLGGSAAVVSQPAADVEAKVDRVFEKWTASTPGCAVGVSVGGKPALARAYGMADLEHDIKNTPETIFEAGSVSKQFTAAAVLLLAREGKLSLDDPARKYLPEIPDYGAPLTIRHMLNHTSGLRDWGSVAGIGGWPRGSRAYTHAHVLDIVRRQRALNFPPGSRWSYSNTGYNLAAILVSRVSGMAFAEFTRQRIFEPMGMTHTSWRDDHTRIVKGRAISYLGSDNAFRTQMPFHNVHGNGGLLTTVGDLLKWNEHFVSPKIGDQKFVDEQQQRGAFTDGRPHGYALGLQVGDYQGLREVAHGGATAGYRAYLTRYPDAQVSVALLCNAGSVNPELYAHSVADIYLAGRLKPSPPPAIKHRLTAAEAETVAGLYRDTMTGEPTTLSRTADGVRLERGPVLFTVSPTRFVTAGGDIVELGTGGSLTRRDAYGSVYNYARVAAAAPTVDQLRELTGIFASEDAEVVIRAELDGASLVLKRRPDTVFRLSPLYADAFDSQLGTIVFRRDGGRVTGFSVVQDRVWDLRFTKQIGANPSTQ